MHLPLPVYYSCLLSALVAGPVCAAVPPTDSAPMNSAQVHARTSHSIQFKIPAAAADKSLPTFSRQSGIPLVYLVEQVRTVRTNRVAGRFAPRQALERLLANTPLTIVEDSRTGALIVKRAEVQPRPDVPTPAAPPTSVIVKPTPTNTVNTKRYRSWLVGLFSLLAASDPLSAQTTTPGAGSPPDLKTDEVLVLSPFVIDAEEDTGYQSSSTLAGTRLNTPLKDLGASISVYTKDFLNDIGATNANELLIYATSMDAAGPGGNYSGSTDNIMAFQATGDGVRFNPQGGTRTRGLSAPNFARGFFRSDIAVDSYNIESITVNRGPNAILFGVGSPSGVVEATLLRPNLLRNTNKVQVRVGENSSLRNTVDFNRVLIKDKLALRIAALHDEERFNQRPAFEDKESIYGALTYKPYKSSALRMNFESGHTRANRTIGVLPNNSISSFWLGAGRPSYDWSYYDDPARNPNAAAEIARQGVATDFLKPYYLGTSQIFDQILQVYSSSSATAPSLAFRSSVGNSNNDFANLVRNNLFNPVNNRDMAPDAIQWLNTVNIAEHISSNWSDFPVLPGQQPNQVPAGIKMQGFTDLSVFDFKNHMIDETSRQNESFRAFNIAFEQRAWEDRIGIELAYDTQIVGRFSRNSAFAAGGSNHIRIDPNVTLPTGEKNPNLGRPFVTAYGDGNWRNAYTDREAMRATGYLRYDFKDLKASWGHWLGRHTLTGLYERNSATALSFRTRLAVDGDAARSISQDISVFARRAVTAIYLGPTLIGNNNPLKLEAIKVPPIQAGPLAVPATYFQRAADATDPGRYVSAPASLVEINEGGSIQRDVIKSQAAVLQSYWLQDHLITLVGWRRDESFFKQQGFNFVSNPNDRNDPGKVYYGFNDFSLPSTPPAGPVAENMTYSAVLRWPQKLLKLPTGTDFSLLYNRSSNFTPSAGRVTPFNEPIASPEGATEEYGFTFSAFHDKLAIRVNRFETSVLRQSFTVPVFGLAVNNAIFQLADFWGLQGNSRPDLVAKSNADIELLFSQLPPNMRELYGWGHTGVAPNIQIKGRLSQLPGATDTTDYVAKGTEVEIAYNPTKKWRMLANVAKQETVKSNSLPFLKKLMGIMVPVWEQLYARPRILYPINWQPGDQLAKFTSLLEYLDTNIYVPYATALADEGTISAEQRKWRANFVTNYTFGSDSMFGHRLKGWSIGGAVRWESKLGIGYPTTRSVKNVVEFDLANPYYAPAETNFDMWVAYERNLWKDRINWKVQLNARNLFGNTEPLPIGIQPWGEVSLARLAPERRWYLTNTFSF